VLADLNAACSIDFDNRLTGTPDVRGIRVALMSPRLLSNRVNITTFPLGVVPVQSRDLIFDNPATAENEALSDALGRGILSATVSAGFKAALPCATRASSAHVTRAVGRHVGAWSCSAAASCVQAKGVSAWCLSGMLGLSR
jgi:hypothetical protein